MVVVAPPHIEFNRSGTPLPKSTRSSSLRSLTSSESLFSLAMDSWSANGIVFRSQSKVEICLESDFAGGNWWEVVDGGCGSQPSCCSEGGF
ncbi:Hypothetical predicted protein [Olea europaea subsp. europaea]|uniref:Uncharacterized protein n=1 Tax=Olea europaea subsp. europaea TaxID=158383 RepID=A0A8S0QHD3_OLEEU|nr:Hypothetical predicted protein [Olea europaea subsp. europaea]